MIVKRKLYSEEPQASAAELQAEQMRLQREQLKLQRQKEALRAAETRRRIQATQDSQREHNDRAEEEAKNQIRVKKIEQENSKPENVGLYKSRSKVVTPIPMRG